jgi:thermitase
MQHNVHRHYPAGARLAACTAAVMALFGAQPALAQNAAVQGEWAKGRLIVMQRAGLPAAEMAKALKPFAGKSRRMGNSDLHVVELPATASETAVMAQLQRNPHFRFVELDRKVPAAMTSNDPYAGNQWHLPVTRTPAAWDSALGAGVTIAVLDGGVLASHPDLQANVLPGYNAWDGGTVTTDINNHGTAVAGTAAAVLNNGTGVSGVAGAAKILPIRITDYNGTAWYSTIANGVIHAADRGVRVVNCSYVFLWGNASVQSAGNYLKSKGGLLIVSAGNNGVNENSPATSSMISVSATDGSDNLAGWSSYGNMVSVAAPGVGIWTTASNGGYESASGTSFAAPVVAGVVALMMSANPNLSSAQIESLLFSSATDLGAAGRDIYFGYGRVNSEAAVRAARDASAADTQKPSVAITSPGNGTTASGLVPVDVAANDNVGVTRVELRVNGSVVASDSVAPFQFSWDSSSAGGTSVTLTAVAYDAAGNSQASSGVALSTGSPTPADTTPPQVTISNPVQGSTVAGTVSVVSKATDNAGTAGIRQQLYINNKLRQSVTGGSLSYNWNTRKEKAGSYTLTVVATDGSSNRSSVSTSVTRR